MTGRAPPTNSTTTRSPRIASRPHKVLRDWSLSAAIEPNGQNEVAEAADESLRTRVHFASAERVEIIKGDQYMKGVNDIGVPSCRLRISLDTTFWYASDSMSCAPS